MTYPVVPGAVLPDLLDLDLFDQLTQGKVVDADGSNGDAINAALHSASAEVRRECGWHIAPVVDETFILDGPGGRRLILPTLRLVSLLAASQVYPGATAPGDALDVSTALTASIYGVVTSAAGWTSRPAGITVAIRHGYGLDEIADLQATIARIVARRLPNTDGLKQEVVGARSQTFGDTAIATADDDPLVAWRLGPLP